MFLNEAETPRQDLRDRSCCRQQQDRSRHLEPRSSSQKRTRTQQVPHRVRLGRRPTQSRTTRTPSTGQRDPRTSEGLVIIDDTFTHKVGEHIPKAGKFYDYTVPGYIWGQNLIYALYADDKTTYPLGFRLYEKDAQRRVELAIELVDELTEIGVPVDTYLFDTSYCSEEFVTHLESYGKEWVSAVKSDARVSYGGERIRVDALAERIDTVPRTINDETYHIWTQKRDVSRLGKVKLLITEKESDDSDEDERSVKYIVSNKIDAPASHLIELYAMRWRVETFFRNTKQDLGLGDYELRHAAGASRRS